mgnify:CR=1 FL=1
MQFLYTNVLFMMLIPAIVLMYLILTKQSGISKYFTKDTLEKLSVSNQYFSNKARNITLFLALILMIIALARPVTNEKTHNSKQELNAIIIALDVSKSMKAIDIYPNRLEFAKRKVLEIINESKTSVLGLVLFAKSSFILSPLTQDFLSLKTLAENIDTEMNFDNGTNIYSTLEITNKLLKSYNNKNLIILTDGGDNTNFQKEIDFANKNKINVYTIAMATIQGSAIKLQDNNYLTDKNGKIVNVKLNENIKKLSLNTNGGYINYTLNNDDINIVLEDIKQKSTKQKFEQKKFKTYTELFYYPLSLALILLLIAFSSLPTFTKNKTQLSVIFLTLLFSNSNLLNASILDFKTIKDASSAYEKSDYENAIKDYERLTKSPQRDYNLANSLYKNQNFEEAIDLYNGIESDNKNLNFQKLHNLGNAYVKTNNLEKAKTTYEEALKIKNDPETKENLELVNKALEKKEEEKNKKENKDKSDEKNKQKDQNNKNNKEQDKQKENKKSDENKNKDSEDNKEKNKNKDSEDSEVKENQISDLEEEKWLKQIENKKNNPLLKKVESSNEDSSKNPW